MAKPGGRLQAETGRMLRAAMLLFALAWFALLLFPAGMGRQDWWMAWAFAGVPGILNVVALLLLGRAHSLVWGPRSDDEGNQKKAHRSLVRGTWVLVASLVLYALALVAYEAVLRT